MKKILALMFALGAVTTIFAQQSRRDSREVILGQSERNVYNNDHRNDNGNYSVRERDAQIQRIVREYDWKIQSVRTDRWMRNAEKKRKIHFLENEREDRIRDIRDRFYDRTQRYGRRY